MPDVKRGAWYIGEWGFWGWAETDIKLVGFVIGAIAFFSASQEGSMVVADHPHLAALIILALLTLVAVVLIAVRTGQRELFAIGFSFANATGHAALLDAMLWDPEKTTLPILFALCYILGGLAKIRFLQMTGYTEGGQSTAGMLRFTWGVNAVYALFIVLLLV
jgi:hypothetical protein